MASGRIRGIVRFGFHTQSHAPSTGNPADIYPELRELARRAESAGFAYFSVTDHLVPFPGIGPSSTPMLDPWAALAAVATATERIGLLTLVSNVTLRPPAQLAKAAATLDVISGGRMLLGIGSGGHRAEYEALGLARPDARTRAGMLEETAEAVRMLWERPTTTFEGRHFTLRGMVLEPKPLHRPRLLIGGSGALTLRSAARHADLVNFVLPGPERLAALVAALRRHRAEAGPHADAPHANTIEISVLERAVVAPTRAAAEAKWAALGSPERDGHRGLVGAPADVAAALRAYEAAGLDTAMVFFPGGDPESIALFAERVMPELIGTAP